jgi:hypothetical protein
MGYRQHRLGFSARFCVFCSMAKATDVSFELSEADSLPKLEKPIELKTNNIKIIINIFFISHPLLKCRHFSRSERKAYAL